MTARAMTPIHPATILPAPEEAVLEELELDPVAVLLALLLSSDEAVASLVEEAVEEASVAVAVDEPVVVLLALLVVLLLTSTAAAEEVATAVERVVDDTLDKVYVTGVPEDVEEAAVEEADELEEVEEEEVVPSVMLNWLYIAPKGKNSHMVSQLVYISRSLSFFHMQICP